MHHPRAGVQNEAQPQTVAKEVNMSIVAKRQSKEKRGHVNFDGKACWVGVDVHKISYAVAILDEEGQRQEFSTPAEPKKLLLQLLGMGMTIKALAYESGPTGYGLAWACQEFGIPVLVAAPSRIPRPVSRTGKTDRLDSMKLAEFLARDMIKGIAIPTEAENHLRSLERCRQQLVERRRTVRQQIKSLLLFHGLDEPAGLSSWSLASVQSLQAMTLPDVLRITLGCYLNEHAFLLEELSRLRKQLSAALQAEGKIQTVKHLCTIPGVGETIATTFMTEIFRPERFGRAEELCAYVGLAPVTSHSGSGKATAQLGQVGQDYLRSILVQGAWRFISAEPQYHDLFIKIRTKTGLSAKAVVALARKLLVLLWRVAVENRPYRPVSVQ
jgi:transposase